MKKVKIVFVIHSLQAGGMERVVSILSNHIVENKDIEVHIILYGIYRDIFYPLSDKIQIHKPQFKFNNRNRFFSTLRTILFLREKIKFINPISVLSFGEYWDNLVLISTYGVNIPIYIADRSTPLKDLGKVQNILRNYLYPKASGLIVQTEKAKQIYQKIFKNLNISVIANPIRDIKNKKKIKRENIVIMVGRLINTKHQDRLIKIFSKIDNLDWKLILVGDDAKKQNNKEKLTQLINDLKLKNRVVLAGEQKDIESYYLKSKIFAFTSSSEGFPNVIGEAMSSGLPVVAYDCLSGPSDLIKNNNDGFLIPLFNDKIFKRKLELLMNDESLMMEIGNNAKKSIKKFNLDEISELFLSTILGKNRY